MTSLPTTVPGMASQPPDGGREPPDGGRNEQPERRPQGQPERVDALTADGSIVAIRTVTTLDATALADLFRRGSAASLRLRFFAAPSESLLSAEVARLTRPASPAYASICAELAGELVGVASYEQSPPQTTRAAAEPAPAATAEFAVFVDDAHQGRGIGTLLLEHLAGCARRHRITRLVGEVLADNSRMLHVAGDISASATSRLADGTVEVIVATGVDDMLLAAIDHRDRAAERASLRPLLAPSSVAVVGAGRRPGGVGHEVLKGLVEAGFTGPVYPVNPYATAVAGVPAYPSLAQLPGPAELVVVVAVPAGQVAPVLAEAATAGARAAVVLTAGFSEAGAAGVADQAELVRIARVVLKAADPRLVHKSDVDGVHLDLADAGAVDTAYRRIADGTGEPTPAVLVQPMAAGGVELVAGIVHDPLFGSLVMTGLGGVHTDLLADRAFRLVPVTDLDAGRMWRSLRAAPLLTGYRGTVPVDTGAVEDLLLRLGRLAEELPEVAELDLNPVVVGPDGAVAVDAKLRLAPTEPLPDPALRRLR